MFPRLDLYYADPEQPLTTVREELDDLDHDLSDLSYFISVYECTAARSHIVTSA